MRDETRTLVLFESSHRIEACLADLLAVLGPERQLAVCRELTKRFETVLRGGAAEVIERIAADPDQRKGEFVVVVEGAPDAQPGLADALALARELLRELPGQQGSANRRAHHRRFAPGALRRPGGRSQ